MTVLIAIGGFAAAASAQTTVTLSTPGSHINADLTIQGGSYGMVDFSTSDVLASKVSSPDYTRRILLKFDTQNYIPADAVIQSAQLQLVLRNAESSENRPLTAYYVTRSFVKGGATWYYYRDGLKWSTPGGDLGPDFGTTYVGNAEGSIYKFDLTKLVQRAVNGDFGSRYTRVALVDTGAYEEGNYREFHSTRATNAALRPRLVITYGTSTSTTPTSTDTTTNTSTTTGTSGQTTTLSTPGSHINADQTIQGGSYGMVDYRNSDVLASKVSSANYTRRILLKFDTQNYLPANAVIQSAQLHLVLKNAENSENRPLTAYYVTKSFVDGGTNWYYYRDGQKWSTPGGDLGPSFGTTYVGNAEGSTYKFDLTKLVQRVVNGDFGSRYTRVALVDTGADTDGNYREFHSTRATNAALRPRLVITYTTSSTTTPTSPAPTTDTSTDTTTEPPPTSTGTTLRVMQWNIHKTKGSDGVCNPDRIANGIVAQNPHVVSLNEVNFYSGSCAWNFDMGEKLRSLVQQKTGVTWYKQVVNPDGVGNVILSRFRPVATSATTLADGVPRRGVAQMTIVVNGRNVHLFSTHVDYANGSYRTLQTKEVVRWAATHGEPRIIMGDFNTWPNTSDYSIMATPYQDAWVAAQRLGTAWAYNGTGATRGSSRFDYVYYSRVSALSLKSVKVPDMRVNGVWPSDHHPVIAVFSVN